MDRQNSPANKRTVTKPKRPVQGVSPADALRAAGFVTLPRLWVRAEDMPTIHLIANQYTAEVNQIRGRIELQNLDAREERRLEKERLAQEKANQQAIDRAWKAHRGET